MEFKHFDACGSPGFSYDVQGNDITSEENLRKIKAVYEIDGKLAQCSYDTHESQDAEDIEAELRAWLAGR
jgi:hypothetical protein